MSRTARVATALQAHVVLALLLSGCTTETPALFSEVSTATTVAPPGTTTSGVAPESTSTTAAPYRRVDAFGVLLRYEGGSDEGTIEVVVCNATAGDSGEFTVTITAPVQATLVTGEALESRTCAGYHDATVTLGSVAVAGPGTYPVTVAVTEPEGTAETTFEVSIEELTITPDAAQYADYEACVDRGEIGCADYVWYQPVPGEVLKRLGVVQSIAPAELEPLATRSVFANANCIERIEEFLGITGPRPISHRFLVSEYAGGYASPMSRWTSAASLEFHLEGIAMWRDSEWAAVQDGHCDPTTAHELTHVVLGDTPLGGFLNEGLATWMQITERSNGQNGNSDVTCGDDSWYGYDIASGTDTWIPYSNLSTFDPDAPGIYAYYTGECFWNWLENTYGTEKVIEVVQAARALHDTEVYNGCRPGGPPVLFIRDIVNPIIGEDVSVVTEPMFGVGLEWHACLA